MQNSNKDFLAKNNEIVNQVYGNNNNNGNDNGDKLVSKRLVGKINEKNNKFDVISRRNNNFMDDLW